MYQMDMDKKIPVYMWDPNAVITVCSGPFY